MKSTMNPARKPLVIAISLVSVLGAASEAIGADDKERNYGIEEMVVTAQKREQAVIDVPISVTAVNADRLTRTAANRLADYAAQVPGMSVTALSRGYTSVVLRGISTGISQATPSTAFYIDEAPIGSINAYATGSTLTPDLDPFDLQRVEVLKGPQGTLYGAGAVGGLVRYITQRPDSSEFSGAVMVGGNSVDEGDDGTEARAAINVPIVADKLAMRISGFNRKEAGYIDNPISDEEDVNEATTQGGRVALGWDISENWSLQVWGLTQRFDADGIGAEDEIAPDMRPATGELERSTWIPEKQDIELDAYNATLNGEVGDFTIVSSTTYQTVDAVTHVDVSTSFGALLSLLLPLPPGLALGAETAQQISTERVSEEFRVRSSAFSDRLEYEGGLFYTHEESTNRLPPNDPFLLATLTPFPLPLPLADARIDSEYDEYSLFGNATWSFNEHWELLAGARYSKDEQEYLQDYKLSLLTPTPVMIEQDVGNKTDTYLVSLRWKPYDDTAVYARVATGYRPGGPSALPPGIVPGGKQAFEPDTLTSYELGLKTALFDGMASFESAVFTTEWDDVQIQTQTQTLAGTYRYFVNGGTAESSGAEATFTIMPIDGLTLRATGAYTQSELTEDVAEVGGLDGDSMPFVPEWTGSLGVDYRFPIGSAEAWIGGTASYIDDRKSNFSQNFNYLTVDSYTTYNLDAGVDWEHVRLSIYGKNLGDERGITFMNNVGLAAPFGDAYGNPYTAGVIQPRTLGAAVTYTF